MSKKAEYSYWKLLRLTAKSKMKYLLLAVVTLGQQKRINLARAFYHDSDILILDEPTASLDKETKSKVLEAIKREKEKRVVILITHDRETYAICDRML